MAFVRFHDNSCMTLKPEKALLLWQVICGEIEGTPKQQEFAEKVQRLYLNFNTAPQSYKDAYPRYHLSDPSPAVRDIPVRKDIYS